MVPKTVDYTTPIFNNQFTKVLLPPNQVVFSHDKYPLMQNTQYLNTQPLSSQTFSTLPSSNQYVSTQPSHI